MSYAVLIVTYADGQTITTRAVNTAEARRALIKLVNRNGWNIQGNGGAGTLHGSELVAAYTIRTPQNGTRNNKKGTQA